MKGRKFQIEYLWDHITGSALSIHLVLKCCFNQVDSSLLIRKCIMALTLYISSHVIWCVFNEILHCCTKYNIVQILLGIDIYSNNKIYVICLMQNMLHKTSKSIVEPNNIMTLFRLSNLI